ncbi:MAG: recombinase family protein [Nannocystaceae bacterium]|nr:recombinase family protein [bacterium]
MRQSSPTAIAYLRVSTDDQHLGPEAQRAAIEAWATRERVQVVAWREDIGVSGGAPLDRRPGLLAALDDVNAHGCAYLVAAKRCRIARDVVVAAMVERLAEKAGARVVTADGVGAGDGPEAALMRTMVDAFAQYERGLIAARTRAALAAKAVKGQRVGGIPYGHRLADDSVHLELDEAEQAVVTRIRSLRAEGTSQRALVDILNAEHPGACRGARWHRTSVQRLLRRLDGDGSQAA